jgi:mono/diheme cytochrome c family protein
MAKSLTNECADFQATTCERQAPRYTAPIWQVSDRILGSDFGGRHREAGNSDPVMKALLLATVMLVAALAGAQAQPDPAVRRGMVFVRANCSHCHAIDKMSPSRLAIAPPFRTLHTRYPIAYLEEAFAEGIVTSHPTMPQFRLDPGQIADVLAYLKTLEK